MEERLKFTFENFEKAFKNLKEAIKIAKTDLDIDGTIKRFELCYELSWKVIKIYLEYEGIICNSPRECFKYAVLNGLLNNEKVWIDMIDDRNLLVHTYNFENSRVVFERIKNYYLNAFEYLYNEIKRRFEG